MKTYPKRPPSFNRWWKSLKRKPVEQQREIIEKWLYYSCKTVANRADMNQARVVYTIATRYNKSEYKQISRANAQRVYAIIADKQYAHRKQSAVINQLEEENKELKRQLGDVVRSGAHQPKNTVITKRKTRKIVTGGTKHA